MWNLLIMDILTFWKLNVIKSYLIVCTLIVWTFSVCCLNRYINIKHSGVVCCVVSYSRKDVLLLLQIINVSFEFKTCAFLDITNKEIFVIDFETNMFYDNICLFCFVNFFLITEGILAFSLGVLILVECLLNTECLPIYSYGSKCINRCTHRYCL